MGAGLFDQDRFSSHLLPDRLILQCFAEQKGDKDKGTGEKGTYEKKMKNKSLKKRIKLQKKKNSAIEEPPTLSSGFLPALREGVVLLQMVFYMRFRDWLTAQEPELTQEEIKLISGAMVNRLFGEKKVSNSLNRFMKKNLQTIDEKLSLVPDELQELRIPITDALRMHFFLNRFQGTGDQEMEILALKNAKKWGILIEERQVPWPKGFMEMTYRIGKAYGLIKEQQIKEQPT